MRLFRKPTAPPRLEERIDQLRDDCDTLLREMRGLKLEQLELYDKTHRLFGRIAKRAAIDNPVPGPAMLETETAEPGVDQISAAIQRRRAKG